MVSMNVKCKHPNDWIIKLVYGGKRYTYCVGCLIEKNNLRNLEAYDNPFIKYKDAKNEEDTSIVIEKNKIKITK